MLENQRLYAKAGLSSPLPIHFSPILPERHNELPKKFARLVLLPDINA